MVQNETKRKRGTGRKPGNPWNAKPDRTFWTIGKDGSAYIGDEPRDGIEGVRNNREYAYAYFSRGLDLMELNDEEAVTFTEEYLAWRKGRNQRAALSSAQEQIAAIVEAIGVDEAREILDQYQEQPAESKSASRRGRPRKVA